MFSVPYTASLAQLGKLTMPSLYQTFTATGLLHATTVTGSVPAGVKPGDVAIDPVATSGAPVPTYIITGVVAGTSITITPGLNPAIAAAELIIVRQAAPPLGDAAMLRTFSNDYTPVDGTELGDLTESAYSGYAAQALGTWLPPRSTRTTFLK